MTGVFSEYLDQPGHPPSLISWRRFGSKAHSKGWSDWAGAQADLSLRLGAQVIYWFCQALAHFKSSTGVALTFILSLRSYTLCKTIHVQWNDTCPTVIPRICMCIKQVLIGWKLIFGYKVQWQQIHRTVERDLVYPGFWLVENCSTVRCIGCHWTLYPKINFQPIRTCLTRTQFRGMTVGHVPFRWTIIALHSVS